MISYAQNFGDVMLARVFGGRTDGFYVDVGAGDAAPAIATSDETQADAMADYVGIDAIRKANWTLSSPGLLASHVWNKGLHGPGRRLRRQDR
jgi:hypothetical protein